MAKYKVIVLGIGNILRSDDQLGARVIADLGEYERRDILTIEAGTAPLHYLSELSETENLIVVDIIAGNKKPGEIYHFSSQDRPAQQKNKTQLHNLSLNQLISLAQEINDLPQSIYYYGLQGADWSWGTSLSSPVKKALPKLISLLEAKIKELTKN